MTAETASQHCLHQGEGEPVPDEIVKPPKGKPILEKATPPWHAVAFVCTVMTTCVHQCRTSVQSLDQVAVLETFTHRIFPQYVSLPMLGWIRAAIAASIWIVFYNTLTSDGWVQTTSYPSGSRLQSGVKIMMRGSRTLFPFTSWCWILLGVSFTFHAALALAVAYQGEDWVMHYLKACPWFLRGILLTWETTAPCALLVSSVIRYAIWDKVKKGPGNTVHLKHIRNIFSHNLNSVFVLTEVALLGGLPVRMSEMYLGPFLGSIYVWIAWSLTGFWVPTKKHGPHYIYFFLDTTLGYKTTMALVALSATLCLFYVLLARAVEGLNLLADVILLDDFPPLLLACHVTFVLGIASLVCRFND